MAFRCFFGVHKWEGCSCLLCDRSRHEWKGNRCETCGSTRQSAGTEYVYINRKKANPLAIRDHVDQHPCSCGGTWTFKVSSGDVQGHTYVCFCSSCGLKKRFDFVYR